ncbi:unnamed protein product [Callosobruchus maculatus]|uniref:Uncharacterized protein n=1 Tax=Callosobruchus maculatus TaxID=64391 RepID=A0A653CZC3_CALMS|nr:unnamed protein product [Callosobruchus maculatus]
MAANEQNMEMEVGEVKVEKTELDTESLGIEHNSWGLVVEGDHDERTNRIIGFQRIKDLHNFVEAGSNIEVLEMQSIKTKVEENWEDCKQFEPTYTTDEGIIEHDNNDDFIDEDKKIALDRDISGLKTARKLDLVLTFQEFHPVSICVKRDTAYDSKFL